MLEIEKHNQSTKSHVRRRYADAVAHTYKSTHVDHIYVYVYAFEPVKSTEIPLSQHVKKSWRQSIVAIHIKQYIKVLIL